QLLVKGGPSYSDPFPAPVWDGIYYTATQDIEGNLWFGTLRDGLLRARRQLITTLSTAEGLADNNVYPIFQDAQDNVWVGTTRGLFRWVNGRFAVEPSAETFYVQTLGTDSKGRVVTSNGDIAYVWNGSRFEVLLDADTSGLVFYAVHADREGALWLGGNHGLIRLKDGLQERFSVAEGLVGNDVKVVIDARSGGIWVGTYAGISRIENGKITSWSEADGLPSRTVRTLYEDADGVLWVGTYDGGIARFK